MVRADEPRERVAGDGVGIPFSRVYEVADEARRRASAWQEFASSVEARARGRQDIRAL